MSPTRDLFLALAFSALLPACASDAETHEHERSGEHAGEARSEHDREGPGEHGGAPHDEEGEESGAELSLFERYDAVRGGARLVMAYDAPSRAFVGTVENTTERTLEQVRVEVHLSNGRELGPTEPVNLAPGARHDVRLTPESTDFERWNAHPEVGRGEHDGEGSGEHGGEHGGDHD